MDLLTNSSLKAARSCLRLHQIEYVQGYRPANTAQTLHFGDLVHRGLEAWWLAAMHGGDRLAAALAAMQGEADPYERARAEVLLIGYDARWGDEQYEVLAVEKEFRAPLVNPETGAASKTWTLAGKVDAIVRDAKGRVLVVEHKTSSENIEQGSEYWRRLRMDGQVSIYFEGARSLGYDVEVCLYDVLGKPGTRPGNVPVLDESGAKIVLDAAGQRVRTKDGKKWRESADSAAGYVLQTRPETPEEYRDRLAEAVIKDPNGYFQRGDVVRLEDELHGHLVDIWQFAQGLRDWVRTGRAPRNPDACVRFGRTCSFFDVCSGTASLEDPARFIRLNTLHPELAEELTPAGA